MDQNRVTGNILPGLKWTMDQNRVTGVAIFSEASNVPSTNFKSLVTFSQASITSTNKIKMVLRRVARFVCTDISHCSSVTAMLQSHGWTFLERRRTEAKARMMYQIVNNLFATVRHDIPPASYTLCSQIHPTSYLYRLLQTLLPISCESLEQYPWQCCPGQHHTQLQDGLRYPWSQQGIGLQCFKSFNTHK